MSKHLKHHVVMTFNKDKDLYECCITKIRYIDGIPSEKVTLLGEIFSPTFKKGKITQDALTVVSAYIKCIMAYSLNKKALVEIVDFSGRVYYIPLKTTNTDNVEFIGVI